MFLSCGENNPNIGYSEDGRMWERKRSMNEYTKVFELDKNKKTIGHEYIANKRIVETFYDSINNITVASYNHDIILIPELDSLIIRFNGEQ